MFESPSAGSYSWNQEGTIILGDAREVLRTLPDGLCKTCVAAPPYWGLRASETGDLMGAERDLDDYLKKIEEIGAEIHRVVADNGTFWLNMGDAYVHRGRSVESAKCGEPLCERPERPSGLKEGDLIGIPWRVAFSLREAGWYLRCDIIWHKTDSRGEVVDDRPTRAHEYLFLFAKSEHYFYDKEAILEPSTVPGKFRNRRTVWSCRREPQPGFPMGTCPVELARRCILASTGEGDRVLDPFFGSGSVGVACRETNRRFVGIEINDEYAALAARRLGWPADALTRGPVVDAIGGGFKRNGESPSARKPTVQKCDVV